MDAIVVRSILFFTLCGLGAVWGVSAHEPGSRLRLGTLDGGGGHTCALQADGRVKCWGWNLYGQLGNRTITNSKVPVFVTNLSNAVAVTTGQLHSCALIADGTVRCWGRNNEGQAGLAGNSDAWEPFVVQGLSQVVAVDAGAYHTCALVVSGSVKCWGDNLFGQLGNATNTDSGSPVTVAGLARATAVSAGENHTCALRTDGRVKCWGLGTDGRLGQGEFASANSAVFVTGLVEAVSVSAGGLHTCATTARGRAWCWGYNGYSQLGEGTLGSSASPKLVKTETGFLGGVIDVRAGSAHTCALLSGGNVNCWGQNADGQVGNGSPPSTEPFVSIPVGVQSITGKPLTGVAALGVGTSSNCVVLASGGGRCWGRNVFGELGSNEDIYSASTARAVSNFSIGSKPIALVSAWNHSCAQLGTGKVKCWGLNDEGQLGSGQVSTTPPRDSAAPVEVVALEGVVALASGSGLTCALLANGRVKCWGGGSPVPFLIQNLSSVVSIAIHTDHSCVVLANGGVKCWGADGLGQLGNGPGSPEDSLSPVAVQGLAAIKSVAVGSNESCAVKANGEAFCWGAGLDPQAGTNSETPVLLTMGVNTLAVVGAYEGYAVACGMPGSPNGLLGDRKCLGNNSEGLFGNGSTGSSPVPVRVTAPANITNLTLADTHACARVATGGVRCWGSDASGQVGDGPDTNTPKLSPVAVKNLARVASISVGNRYSCALLANGTAKCWGSYLSGRLGNPLTSDAQEPVPVLGL